MSEFQFGDIIENGYASHDNPTRVGVFIRYGSNPRGTINAGRFIECRSGNGAFWKTDLKNDRLKKIGSILAPSEASLSRTGAVKVLEWDDREERRLGGVTEKFWRAQTAFDWGYRIKLFDGRFEVHGQEGRYATLDAAKAAAQADYERRIRSALVEVSE